MIDLTLGLLVLIGVALTLLMRELQRRLIGSPAPKSPELLPAISILKPLKGADEDLEENLRTFFHLDYPKYELLFGVNSRNDAALPIVFRLIARYPLVSARVVVDGRSVGLNPKVNNLANMSRHARHDVWLVSDSNVRVQSDYLRDLGAHLSQPGVGLVSSPIRGIRGDGVGGALEALQLNTFVMGGVSALTYFKHPCVVGKSMLFRHADLGRIGGFTFLGRFLAEDQVCGEEVAALGHQTAVSGRPVDNVLGPIGLPEFAARHLRWARIRRRICPLGYAGEILLNPVAVAFVGLVLLRSPYAAGLFGAAWISTSIAAFLSERDLDLPRSLPRTFCVELLRSVLVGLLWPVPFFSTKVSWRGNDFRVGPRTRLLALD